VNEDPSISASGSTENDSDDQWWQTASLSASRTQFREALAKPDPSLVDISNAWLSYWAVANSKGLTRGASKALALLLEGVLKQGKSLEDLTDPSPTMRVGFCRFFCRALIALAEQPRIALPRLQRLEHELAGFAARIGLGETDASAIRLAINAPLGRHPLPEDLLALREYWERTQKDSSDEDEGNSAAYCEAALGQILADNLLQLGDVHGAISVTKQVVEKSPCMSGCALAPQGILSLILEPLRQAGEEVLARSWEQKLATSGPPSHTWMAPAGARIRYLARTGDGEKARQVIEDTRGFTREPQTSAWQRFQFFWGSTDALTELGRSREAENYLQEAKDLACAFDQRNETRGVSQLLCES